MKVLTLPVYYKEMRFNSPGPICLDIQTEWDGTLYGEANVLEMCGIQPVMFPENRHDSPPQVLWEHPVSCGNISVEAWAAVWPDRRY